MVPLKVPTNPSVVGTTCYKGTFQSLKPRYLLFCDFKVPVKQVPTNPPLEGTCCKGTFKPENKVPVFYDFKVPVTQVPTNPPFSGTFYSGTCKTPQKVPFFSKKTGTNKNRYL